MRELPSYSKVESNYDIDHLITETVKETILFVAKVRDEAKTDEDRISLLKAIVTTIIEEM